jgi:hypothetical protein
MRQLLVIFALLLMTSIAVAKSPKFGPVPIAVIDTGYNGSTSKLCRDGHYDFVAGTPTVGRDQQGHGTVVVDAINTYGEDGNYCLMILKVFGAKGSQTRTNVITDAIKHAVSKGALALNLSLDGPGYNSQEKAALEAAVATSAVVFVAAGNAGVNLDKTCISYPACYRVSGVIVVGSIDDFGKLKGNYGKIIDEQEPWCHAPLCGTSMSTGIATGKFASGYP